MTTSSAMLGIAGDLSGAQARRAGRAARARLLAVPGTGITLDELIERG